MKKIRWGIAGCGGIAGRMARVLNADENALITVAAAREQDRARDFAAAHHIPVSVGSYDELACSEEVDAVYIATIHPSHYDIAYRCISEGKAVLCEKPLTMNAAQTEALFSLAREKNVLLAEAMWTRFLPAWESALEMAGDGAIGTVRGLDADFLGYFHYSADSRLFNKALGGSAMLDIGVYCIHMALFMLGYDYRVEFCDGRLSRDNVDIYSAVTLEYKNGIRANLRCSVDMSGPSDVTVFGTGGWMRIPIFYDAKKIILQNAQGLRTIEFDDIDGFTYEIRAFQKALSEGRTELMQVPPASSIQAARLMDTALERIGAENLAK